MPKQMNQKAKVGGFDVDGDTIIVEANGGLTIRIKRALLLQDQVASSQITLDNAMLDLFEYAVEEVFNGNCPKPVDFVPSAFAILETPGGFKLVLGSQPGKKSISWKSVATEELGLDYVQTVTDSAVAGPGKLKLVAMNDAGSSVSMTIDEAAHRETKV